MNDNFKKLFIRQESNLRSISIQNSNRDKRPLRRMSTGLNFAQINQEKTKEKSMNLTLNSFSINKDQKEQIFALQNQLVQFKTYFNSKEKDFHSMKIAYLKLEGENKKNLRLIQKILSNVNLNRQVDDNKDNFKLIGDIENLKETFVITSLKNEIHKLKHSIEHKEKEIEELKKHEKISKFINIQDEYKKFCDDYKILDYNYCELKQKYETLLFNHKLALDERDSLKSSLQKMKSLYDEVNKMLKFYQSETTTDFFEKKEMKEKLHITKYSQKYLLNKIKQLEDEKEEMRKKNKEIDEFNSTKQKYEESLANLTKKFNFVVFEKEQLSKKLKQKEQGDEGIKPIQTKHSTLGKLSFKNKRSNSGNEICQNLNDYQVSKSSVLV